MGGRPGAGWLRPGVWGPWVGAWGGACGGPQTQRPEFERGLQGCTGAMALEGWWAASLGSSLEQAAWKKLGELGFEAHSSLPPETAGIRAESSPAPPTRGGAGLVPLVVGRALLDSGAVWQRRQGVGWGRAGGYQHPPGREEASTQLCPATQGGNCRAGVHM